MNENKLCFEKSLYLTQHASNPIHWYAWGEEAIKKAEGLNKPIFLSIGYSSCHWCHVMAHESFEDESTAAFLNEHFISIKVDREEYPDLDHYYQKACSIITGRGGWPLSIFLTPDTKPFFAGTYFPKADRKESPSFMKVLKQISDGWKVTPSEIIESSKKLITEINRQEVIEKKIEFKGHFPGPSAIMNALKNYADTKNGGYSQAPKFPHFPFLEWACEQILEGMIPQEQGQHIVESVERMLMGGVYDHAKGGIHRYSTDEKFLVPHFEKMLYDQAGLLKVLSKLSQFYPAPLIFDSILQTIDYLKSEMVAAEENYFFSTQDADSEGTEGLYFTFSKEEFEASFDDAPSEQKIKLDKYLEIFNISEKGNFTHGLNVLSLNPSLKAEFYTQEGWQEIREIKRRLLEQRKLRIPPGTDRKGLSGWNYLLLSSLCDVVQYCPIDSIQNEAFNLIKETVEGCLNKFIQIDGNEKHILRHCSTLEKQALYLEDYVNFSDAQLRLYEITGNEVLKKNALETMDFIVKNFIKDGEIYVTSIEEKALAIENLRAPLFDQSYRSSAMSLVLMMSRLSVFRPELSPQEILKNKFEDLSQFVLSNPLNHGEGLRALTYPINIFRRIEVPIEWIESVEFINMRSHFFARFVIDYHSRKDDSFQICTNTSCEVDGKGIEMFQGLFKGQEESNA